MGRKRVAINALIMDERKAGIGNYAYNLIKAISTLPLDMDIDVHIQGHMKEFFKDVDGVNFRLHRDFENSRQRIMYELFRMPSIYRRGGYDIVHFIDYLSPFLPIGAKRVYTIHDLSYFKYRKTFTLGSRLIKQIFTNIAARLADGMICVSKNTRDDLKKRYKFLKEDTLYVTHLAADQVKTSELEGNIELLREYGIDDRFILYVGTIEPRKNIDVLLKAYKEIIKETGLPQKLVLCGKLGWRYQSILDTIEADEELKRRVIHPGYVPDDILPLLYREADVFVYPSLYEGFGLPPLEAMTCGTPVIVSNTSSLPEVVGDGGLYFHPHDHVELGLLLVGILTDDGLREELEKRGIKQAAKFSWEKTGENTLSVYRDVAE